MKAIFRFILVFALACGLEANSNEITLKLPDSPPETIAVDFPDSSVFDIISAVSKEFSLEVEIPGELKDYRTSIRLVNVGWESIFDVTLNSIDYTYLETADHIKILTQAEFDSLPLVEFEWQFIFIPVDEFIRYHDEKLPISPKLNERMTIKENTLIIQCHPSHLARWKDLLLRSDTPTGLPRYPRIYWPETIPQSVETKERLSLPYIDHAAFGIRVYCVEWVDPKLLKAKVTSYLDGESERVSLDLRSQSLVISARGDRMSVIMNVCEYLDERHWYSPNLKPERVGGVGGEAAFLPDTP